MRSKNENLKKYNLNFIDDMISKAVTQFLKSKLAKYLEILENIEFFQCILKLS